MSFIILFHFSGEFDRSKLESKVLKQIISRLQSELKEMIVPSSDFVDSLFSKKIISFQHALDIGNAIYSKNDIILDYLLYRYDGDCNDVIEALTETDQSHVVNFIKSNGGTYIYYPVTDNYHSA